MTIINLGKDHQEADEDLYSGEFRLASTEPTKSGTTTLCAFWYDITWSTEHHLWSVFLPKNKVSLILIQSWGNSSSQKMQEQIKWHHEERKTDKSRTWTFYRTTDLVTSTSQRHGGPKREGILLYIKND